MNLYENIIILDPNLDNKAIERAVEQVKNIIIKKGGEVLKSENWGHKKLAYEIKKQKKGTYILLLFKAPPTIITELERFYKVLDLLLKFMIIKLKKKEIKAVLSSLSQENNKETEPAIPEKEHKSV